MKKVIYFSLWICSSLTFASESNFSIVYGYGQCCGMEHPSSYPLSIEEKKNYYKLSTSDNNKEQNSRKLFAHLSVTKVNYYVIAKVKFINLSKDNYFVHRNRLALANDWANVKPFYYMCGKSFIITTNNTLLDYVGKRCHFDKYYFENDWVEIPSKQSRSFGFVLNNEYAFLPGRHRYDIGSLEYYVTDEKWIVMKKIYRSLFNLIGFRFGICSRMSVGGGGSKKR